MIVPVVLVLWWAVYSRKYIHGVADYLAAGRVAGRYVIAVGGLESSLGVITLVALVEAKYQTGYALTFWETLAAPVAIVMSLTGYCVYRFGRPRLFPSASSLNAVQPIVSRLRDGLAHAWGNVGQRHWAGDRRQFFHLLSGHPPLCVPAGDHDPDLRDCSGRIW